MKILHTSDWHIGQLFYEYDRTFEHQRFLDWLLQTLKSEEVDVLLVSGDVFDLSNPSAASVKMFYHFLNRATSQNPHLQVIVTAGNHDSAARLESPKPLLESTKITIIGVVEKDETGKVDCEKLLIPLKGRDAEIKAWCMAVPFLRTGDYPVITDCDNPYEQGVAELYNVIYQHACTKKLEGHAVICMGHLHTQQAEVTDMDKSERLIMGGVECIGAAAFHDDIKYVALGHIHKAQRIGGKEHVRYCGSPIPMSFSELNYRHQVIVFELENQAVSKLNAIEIPISIALQRIPSVHSSLTEVINSLLQLPAAESDSLSAPYLEVRVLLDGPEPGLRHKIETALTGKHVRLAKIDVKYPLSTAGDNTTGSIAGNDLRELQPRDVFEKVYQSTYDNPVPKELAQLFEQVTGEVAQSGAL